MRLLLLEVEDDGPWNDDVGGDFVGVETGQAVRDHIANTYFQTFSFVHCFVIL